MAYVAVVNRRNSLAKSMRVLYQPIFPDASCARVPVQPMVADATYYDIVAKRRQQPKSCLASLHPGDTFCLFSETHLSENLGAAAEASGMDMRTRDACERWAAGVISKSQAAAEAGVPVKTFEKVLRRTWVAGLAAKRAAAARGLSVRGMTRQSLPSLWKASQQSERLAAIRGKCLLLAKRRVQRAARRDPVYVCGAFRSASGLAQPARLHVRQMERQRSDRVAVDVTDVRLQTHDIPLFEALPPLAEAKSIHETPVAGWSGNMDFMAGDACHVVRCRMVPVCMPFGPYKGLAAQWAEPDTDAAAGILRGIRATLLERHANA